MDINYYLAREQVEQVMARVAMTPQARDAHSRLAANYRDLISHHRAAAIRPAQTAMPRPRG